MERYAVTVEDGVVLLVGDEDGQRFEVGPMDDIVDRVGGETYVLAYDDASAYDWLPADGERRIEVDVRDTVETLSFTPAFVAELAQRANGRDSGRVDAFAEMLVEIWESKGEVDWEGTDRRGRR